MKKLIFAIVISIMTLTGIHAQNYKWWVGGRTNLWLNDNVTTFSFAPEIGYQLSPKFTLAASLGYHTVVHETDKSVNQSLNGFIINPYMRYIAFKKGIVLGFVDGGVEFGLGDYEGVQVGFKPGIAILLNERFTAATQFGFIGYNDGNGIGGRSKGVGIDLSGYCTTIAFFYSF